MEVNQFGLLFIDGVAGLKGLDIIMHLFFAFILAIYTVFAFLMVRQVKLLNKSFHTEAAFLLQAFAYGHFFATLLLLLFTVATIF